MRLKEIYEIADAVAPFSLSREYCEKYDFHDNSGVIVDCGEEIDKILFALDCSAEAVSRAKETGAQLLFTHHPAIFSPLYHLSVSNGGERALLSAIRAGISVISAHLNLDSAEGGIDDCLMRGLGGSEPAIMHVLSCGGYGRAYDADTDSESLLKRIRTEFCTDRVIFYGEQRKISRIASFCGAGMDEETLVFAKREGADTIVTSDGKHHLIAAALGEGMNVVLMTHYASELYGFNRFYRKIKEKTGLPCEFFTDIRLL